MSEITYDKDRTNTRSQQGMTDQVEVNDRDERMKTCMKDRPRDPER